MVWDPGSRPARAPEHIVPDGCPELIVHMGDPFSRRIGGRWRRQPEAFLAGTLSRPWNLRAGSRLRTLGIRFKPGAFTALFRTDMSTHADREAPLAQVMPASDARELLGNVTAAGTNAARFRAAEAWLSSRVPDVETLRSNPTRRAVRLVLESRGQTRIDAIAEALGISRRRLERSFARDLGIRPKLYARIVRLNAALAALGDGERVRMVDAALEAGYFDQAHMAREFRAVAGRPASARPGAGDELARQFKRQERLLVALSGE
jgi:AraC-like DNA-binding protein